MKHITVALLVHSELLAAGLSAVLGRMRDPSVTVRLFKDNDITPSKVLECNPSLIIAEPLGLTAATLVSLKAACCVAAVCVSALPPSVTRDYDDSISIYDPISTIESKVREIASDTDSDDSRQELSPREKDVVVGIVKGMSNKEIATEINVSVNTVMTHRRNIATKLQIHSAAGLTIYAIVKKLVKLDEIRSTIDA